MTSSGASATRPEDRYEGRPQRGVRVGHANVASEVREAGDAVHGDAARDDAGEMGEIGVDVQANAMEADPAPQLDADGGDLVLPGRPGLARTTLDPDADPPLAHVAVDAEPRQGVDDPGLQRHHEGANVAAARREVEHHIGHPLAGPVVGELAAAPAAEHRKPPRLEQVRRLGRDARGVERRVFQQPDQFARLTFSDRASAPPSRSSASPVGHERRRRGPTHDGGVRPQQFGAASGLA